MRLSTLLVIALLSIPGFSAGSGSAFAASRQDPPGPILSEAMADPAAVPDAQGEFLEIGNPGADTLRLDSFRIEVAVQGAASQGTAAPGVQSLVLGRLTLDPGGLFLLCRDSQPSVNGGMACDRRWGSLSLANGRPAEVSLSWNGSRNDYSLPASRSGVSWENTWEAGESFRNFALSGAPWSGGDSATPGFRNSRSALRPERDLGIVAVTWIPTRGAGGPRTGGPGTDGAEGYLETRVANRGSAGPPGTFLSLRLDADWDGEAETFLDSLPVAMPASGDAVVRCGAGAGVRGIVHARLGRDEDPSNDSFLLPVEPGRPLAITEWRPAPVSGEPEWVEIRNRTADSGGIGRRLDLTHAAFNGQPLGSKAGSLDPGGFLVLTESLDRFRSRFGALKARVLQPAGWHSLRNTGDTLVLSLAGITVDSLVYGAVSGAQAAAAGSPGFSGAAAEADGWSLSGKVAGPGRLLDVEVRTAPGRSYSLRVFDLEGNRVRDLGGGGPGRRLHSWDGRGDGGAPLNPGPYILCLSRDRAGPRRAAVIVMDSP